jgi:hypothetical protein
VEILINNIKEEKQKIFKINNNNQINSINKKNHAIFKMDQTKMNFNNKI